MEIERKFLLNPDYDVYDIVTCYPHEIIADYYFNPTTRLRHINNLKNESKQFITIKSIGTLERDEYEYEIKPTYNLPKVLLKKTRYYVPYKNHTFEVNIYDNYFHIPDFISGRLYLIEVELNDKNEELLLPPWIGKEVTECSWFYNYNLFTILQRDLV